MTNLALNRSYASLLNAPDVARYGVRESASKTDGRHIICTSDGFMTVVVWCVCCRARADKVKEDKRAALEKKSKQEAKKQKALEMKLKKREEEVKKKAEAATRKFKKQMDQIVEVLCPL